MPGLLEITGDDVAALSDVDLRDLIGLLCEADYQSAGRSRAGVTWGGHQDAADGGLDVVVRGEDDPPYDSFVPRAHTGFQVKKGKMESATIKKEMCPRGVLRPSIKELIQSSGAYIIVSSAESTTNSSLKKRIEAMKAAVANEVGGSSLEVDFFDRGRVATWLRSHPSLILKVRQQIGAPLSGWQPYGNWANPQGVAHEEYLFDDRLRLNDQTTVLPAKELSVQDGLMRLREVLSAPRRCVRLVGLSGVGKTRLVQALFDERIASNALNPDLAYYTNMSDGPEPNPCMFADQLIAGKERAILVVDNCPPELHRQIAQRCSSVPSETSLLTVEYDVRDDVPAETEVFRLDPASEQVVAQVIEKRFPHITSVAVRSIAEFSGGNARLAIALANTVELGETLSGFREADLFDRLFWQRNDEVQDLSISAEICSLVYSFDGQDTQSESSELRVLASLAHKTTQQLHRDVATLSERQLIQSRHVWRAVLPHALANRLAVRALESIPTDEILETFLRSSERLIKSFTRRLGYLHDCGTAVRIVDELLAPQGWLGKDVCNLNQFGITVLENIAPVSPGAVLDAIERVAAQTETGRLDSTLSSDNVVRILRHIAFEPEHFLRSAGLLSRLALSVEDYGSRNYANDELVCLFYACLSGTRASANVRSAFIEEFVNDGDPKKVELGMLMLDAALESAHFSSSHEFAFGARPRDFGYRPTTREEIGEWYETFLSIGVRLCLSDEPVADRARQLVAEKMRGLYRNAGILDALEEAARKIHAHSPWNDGWLALRGIMRMDAVDFSSDVRDRLVSLEAELAPKDLLNNARVFALRDHRAVFDLADDHEEEVDGSEEGWRRACDKTRDIGRQVANDDRTLAALLPELVSVHTPRLYCFGEGLAYGAVHRSALWSKMCAAFRSTPFEERAITVFRGFLAWCAKNDLSFYHSTLDALVGDDALGPWFPGLQTTAAVDEQGVRRLHQSLNCGKAPIDRFECIANGPARASLSDVDVAGLVDEILARDGGATVAIDILQMYFHGDEGASFRQSEALNAVARKMLSTVSFDRRRPERRLRDRGHVLARVAEICLSGPQGNDAATAACQNLALQISTGSVHGFEIPELLATLASLHPHVFLDAFLGDQTDKVPRLHAIVTDGDGCGSPFGNTSDDVLISWCDGDPARRYRLIAASTHLVLASNEDEPLAWKPLVLKLLERAPDVRAVLEELGVSIVPNAWGGRRSDVVEKRLVLLENLFDHHDENVKAWARNFYRRTREVVSREREWERARKVRTFETFE